MRTRNVINLSVTSMPLLSNVPTLPLFIYCLTFSASSLSVFPFPHLSLSLARTP